MFLVIVSSQVQSTDLILLQEELDHPDICLKVMVSRAMTAEIGNEVDQDRIPQVVGEAPHMTVSDGAARVTKAAGALIEAPQVLVQVQDVNTDQCLEVEADLLTARHPMEGTDQDMQERNTAGDQDILKVKVCQEKELF